jgi:hypothetical protein
MPFIYAFSFFVLTEAVALVGVFSSVGNTRNKSKQQKS